MNPRRSGPPSAAAPWMLALVLAAAAFSLACRLVSPQAGSAGGSFSDLLLVGSQDALSDTFYAEADVYFHRGIEHIHKQVAIDDPIQALFRRISPVGHLHAVGTDAREIVPWLRFATEANPHNVVAYRLAAYTVATDLRRPDLAEAILREAERNNPRDYRIELEWGHLYLKQKKLIPAARALDLALAHWPSGLDRQDEGVLKERVQALLLRAVVYLLDDNRQAALNAYAEVLRMFPDRADVRDRMTAVQRGADATAVGRAMLEILLRDQPHPLVEAEDHDEDAGHAHDSRD